jgi:hypothetical protein
MADISGETGLEDIAMVGVLQRSFFMRIGGWFSGF